jgi:hypothetical protein
MKSGVIIYVAGNAPEYWTEDYEASIKSSETDADLVEIKTTERLGMYIQEREKILGGVKYEIKT